jgi:hypothetical protein
MNELGDAGADKGAFAGATMNLCKNLWDSFTMVFATTEAWSNLGFYDEQIVKISSPSYAMRMCVWICSRDR